MKFARTEAATATTRTSSDDEDISDLELSMSD